MRRRLAATLSVILGLSFAVAVPAVASAEPVQAPPVVINELQSNDPSKAKDWVELYNPGTEVADLSGWKVRDNSSAGEALPQNTVVPAGGYLVLSQDTHFTFGLGNGDEFHLATPDGTEVDSMTYAAHPTTSWGRCPDGQGAFGKTAAQTPGEPNLCTVNPADVVRINEVESSGGDPADWVELTNTSDTTVDVGGLVIKDNDDTHAFVIPTGTTIPGKGFAVFVVDAAELGSAKFGLGEKDSARLFAADGTTVIDSYTWTAHASTTYGRCPDGSGAFVTTAASTKGAANSCPLPAGADKITITEVSSDPSDWVELYNAGASDVDVSGWRVDDDQTRTDVLPAGSIVPAGGYLVLSQNTHFTFGLGKGDQFHLYLADGKTLISETTWPAGAHATPSWARCPDATGTFSLSAVATPGAANDCPTGNPVDKLVLNEVESSGDGSDWVELFNPTRQAIDAGGLVLADNGTANNVTIPAGTTIAAGGYFAIDVTGLGSADSARLFAADGTTLIDSTTWSAHATQTWGRCPDGAGAFGQTATATRGSANDCPPPAGYQDVVINEVESSGGDPGDWVELFNTGASAIDVSGWIVRDNDDTHTHVIEAGTTIPAQGYLVVLTEAGAGGFGLGGADSARLYLPNGTTLVSSYSWATHAGVTYGRCPDGSGEFGLTYSVTKGARNDCSPVRINEIDSKDAAPVDWIELTNIGASPVDVSGYVLRDDKDTSAVVIPAGTTLAPGSYLAIDVDVKGGFGLGAPDAARLFAADGATLLDSYSWTAHAATSYARCPDGRGNFDTAKRVTKGAANDCVGYAALGRWPGNVGVDAVSAPAAYGQDMSGLAYEATGSGRGTLWAVNNGTGTLDKLEWNSTAKQWVRPATGDWKAGKTLRYPGGAGAVDAEGVTLIGGSAASGVYVASERDNTASSVSRPSVLRFDAAAFGTDLVAMSEWNLASLLPTLPANGGLEGITWIPDATLVARGFRDEKVGGAYDPAAYPGHGDGLFFVGVEGTARIYALALLPDGQATLIATIDPKLAVVADVTYDAASGMLYAVCDDACSGEIHAMRIASAGSAAGTFQTVAAYAQPAGMPTGVGNEGFAIGTCSAGVAPVFYADDNAAGGIALREGAMYCNTYRDSGDAVLLNLLNINDFHGRIDENTVAVAGTIEQLRSIAGAENTLLLSAGDNIGASLFASATAEDRPTIDVLNALGLAASAVGNHEFDRGFADLRDRVDPAAQFPYLGANVYTAGTKTPVLQEYALLQAAGLTVGVIGTVTQETPSLVSPGGIAGLDFGDPVEAVNRVAAQLSDGDPSNGEADVIIAEYHEGSADGVAEGATLEQEIAAGGAFARIVTETAPSVDVIFTGHTHKEYAWDAPLPGGGTRPVLQTGSYGANLGQVRLWVDPATGAVRSYDARNVPRTTSSGTSLVAAFPRVAAVKQIVDDALATAAVVGGRTVGSVTSDITTAFTGGSYVGGVWSGGTRDNRAAQSTLGNLVADSLVASLSDSSRGGAEIGLVNPGGLRNELLYNGDGVITYAEANAVLPFVNNLWTTTLTGAQVKKVLEEQWQRDKAGKVPSRSYLQLGVSRNVFYTYDAARAEGDRITGIWINGEPIDPSRDYRVGSFSFLIQGGDNFHTLAQGSATRDSGLIDRDAWIDYIAANSPLSPDYVSRSAQVSGVPATAERGQSITAAISGVNLTSLGAPSNTTALVSIAGSAAILDPVTMAEGAMTASVTVPQDAPASTALVINLEPSGTTIRVPLTVPRVVEPTPTSEPSLEPTPTPTQTGSSPGETAAPVPPAETALTPATQGAIQSQGGTTFEQGKTVTITVGAQYAGQTVAGWIFSTPTYLGTAVVSAAGTATFTIPADLPVGAHRLVVTDAAGTVIGWVYVQVEALAATGGTAESVGMPVLPWAAAVILLGVALVVIRSRQRKA